MRNCWRRSSRSRAGLAARMSSPSRSTSPARRLDEAGQAADERGLAAARQAHDDEDLARRDVEGDVAHRDRAALRGDRGLDGVGVGRSAGALGHLRLGRAEDLPQVPDRQAARLVASGVGSGNGGVAGSVVAVTCRHPPNQPVGPGAVFCQMCLASRYSSRPLGPSSRPMPDCLKPPHSASGR